MDRCFVCNKQLKKEIRMASTCDGQRIYVGPDCYKKIIGMQHHGHQPLLGGPRLYGTMLPMCNCHFSLGQVV